jgi:hypothetical protein
MARSVADIGLCKSTMGSPRLIESARPSCASATGPEDQSGDDRGDAGGGGVVGRSGPATPSIAVSEFLRVLGEALCPRVRQHAP